MVTGAIPATTAPQPARFQPPQGGYWWPVSEAVGALAWVIADGYVPSRSTGPEPEMTSHESASMLNTGPEDAHVEMHAYFTDRDPAGPYRVVVPGRRTLHVRINELSDPEPIPAGTEYALVIVSDVPIVVQHTRLDSRQEANALLSTIAFAAATT